MSTERGASRWPLPDLPPAWPNPPFEAGGVQLCAKHLCRPVPVGSGGFGVHCGGGASAESGLATAQKKGAGEEEGRAGGDEQRAHLMLSCQPFFV